MERKAYHIGFPVMVVMVTFLSGLFMTSATTSYAATSKKKAAPVAATTAVEYTEARIKELKGALKITEGQEVLWGSVTQVMRENAQNMDALSKVRADKAQTMNAVEQIKFHSQMTEAQLEQQKKFIPPFEAFYASLTNDQKAATDALFRTAKHGKHKTK
jgi:hypothetical protein